VSLGISIVKSRKEWQVAPWLTLQNRYAMAQVISGQQ
jgi:hypothetical protein